MTVLLTIAMFASLLFAWICLFNILPALLTSMFQYRLARQRDDLALAILKGEFEVSEPAERMVAMMGGFIQIASDITVFRALIARAATAVSRPPISDEFDYGEATPEDRVDLERRFQAFSRTVSNHALFETPSGWAFVLIALVLALPLLALRAIRPSDLTLKEELYEPISEGVRDLPPSARDVDVVPDPSERLAPVG